MVEAAVTNVNVTPDPLTLATLVLQNRERLTAVEGSHATLTERVDELAPLIKELHADMVGRRAVMGVGGTLLKYVGWGIAGLGAAFGVSQSNTALHWLSQFPTGSH